MTAPWQAPVAYPKARFAVAYTEAFLCAADEPGGEAPLEALARRGYSPAEVIEYLRERLREEAFTGGSWAVYALGEIDHPDYLAYLKAKMGA